MNLFELNVSSNIDRFTPRSGLSLTKPAADAKLKEREKAMQLQSPERSLLKWVSI